VNAAGDLRSPIDRIAEKLERRLEFGVEIFESLDKTRGSESSS
jgi:hypothetical protein